MIQLQTMSDSTHRDRDVPPATSREPITVKIHLEPLDEDDWSLSVTSSLGRNNSARLLQAIADALASEDAEKSS